MTAALVCPGSLVATTVSGQVMRGGLESITVTENEQLAPLGIVQVTRVEPTGKNDPDAGLQVAEPHPAVTSGGWNETCLPHEGALAPICVVTFGGHVIAQGDTVTVNVQEASFADVSVAEHITFVVPTGNTEPDGGLQEEITPGQLSEAVGGG